MAGLCFGVALEQLKNGRLMRRRGWAEHAEFVFLVPGSNFKVNRAPLMGIFEPGTPIEYQAHIDMRTASGRIMVWTPSADDLLANDWEVADSQNYALDLQAQDRHASRQG